eukprot:g2737.t1
MSVICNGEVARLRRFTAYGLPRGSPVFGAHLMLNQAPPRQDLTVGVQDADFAVCVARQAVADLAEAEGRSLRYDEFVLQSGPPLCAFHTWANVVVNPRRTIVTRVEPGMARSGVPTRFRLWGTGPEECARVGSTANRWWQASDGVVDGDVVKLVPRRTAHMNGPCAAAAEDVSNTIGGRVKNGTINATLRAGIASAVRMLTREDPDQGWCAPVASVQSVSQPAMLDAHFEKSGAGSGKDGSGRVDFQSIVLESTDQTLESLKPKGFHYYVRFHYTEARARFSARYVKPAPRGSGTDRFVDADSAVTGGKSPLVSTWSLPSPPAPTGSLLHNKSARTVTVLFSDMGPHAAVQIEAHHCPLSGCTEAKTLDGGREPFVRRWSNASQWPKAQLPSANEEVVVPPSWTLEMDIDPPALSTLRVEGELRFDASPKSCRAVSRLAASAIIVPTGGVLRAGNGNEPFPAHCIANIELLGERTDPRVRGVGSSIDVTSKAMLVAGGSLELHGVPRANSWARLKLAITVGESALEVDDFVGDWRVGEELVVTSTDFDPEQAEIRRIVAVESGRRILIDRPFEYYHHGAPKPSVQRLHDRRADMRAEVALLGRNVRISASQTKDGFGGHLRSMS